MTIRWVTAFLDFPATAFGPGCAFWQAVTASALSPPRGASAQFATLLPEHGDAFLRVQRIDHGIPGCHVDLHAERVEDTAERAVNLGAAVVHEQPGFVVMTSPGGLSVCIVRHRGETDRPPPHLWPGGHRSLVDQLCIDVPSSVFADEGAFWTGLTGWERHPGSRPEFVYLVRPTEMPLRLLLQRLDDDRADRTRAHLDLACDDVDAEQRRHEALGATTGRAMPNWTTLQDPTGRDYCITCRHPDTGVL